MGHMDVLLEEVENICNDMQDLKSINAAVIERELSRVTK